MTTLTGSRYVHGFGLLLRDEDCPTGVAVIGWTGILSRRDPQHFHQEQLPILDDARSRLRRSL